MRGRRWGKKGGSQLARSQTEDNPIALAPIVPPDDLTELGPQLWHSSLFVL